MSEGPLPLGGRVAIVLTGAAGLDGPAVARALAGAGATVVVAGDDAEEAGRILGEIEADGSGRAAFFDHEGGPGSTDALIGFVAEQFRAGTPPAGGGAPGS